MYSVMNLVNMIEFSRSNIKDITWSETRTQTDWVFDVSRWSQYKKEEDKTDSKRPIRK